MHDELNFVILECDSSLKVSIWPLLDVSLHPWQLADSLLQRFQSGKLVQRCVQSVRLQIPQHFHDVVQHDVSVANLNTASCKMQLV